MIKKYLTTFNITYFCLFAYLFIFFSSPSHSKEGNLSLKVLSIDSPFTPIDDNENVFTDDFHEAINVVHPPLLVDYDGKKSLLIFVPASKEDPVHGSLVYNFNLGNQKINEVGRISNDEILSIFGHIYDKDDGVVFILQKIQLTNEETLYGTVRFSILKKDGGLYIQSFKTNRINILALDTCIDGGINSQGELQVCKYKDAASIKKFFDERAKKRHEK